MFLWTVAVCVDRSCVRTKKQSAFVYFVPLVHFVLVHPYGNELFRSRKIDMWTRKEQVSSIRIHWRWLVLWYEI